ncbi:MAG TPA: MBL fold metallo-hydrolase [Phycisphaerae bacterium]|jgi:metallo-beta-lactamase family protein|nr:MBL fold metallo-hydrolase [Phycisphaerae bacterium]HOB76447.1 MBL fold metallo-hydrolase [Phycisphaerae bacterium]HOJ56711.1 MBL fold metallo-hydrolase [Phycisphaerae bacterium]HOL28493.1 MBL fold metallo-hydrolase [Phycisphaerae bacterium]HPP23007.1 MBL fold metallo-hydrolase [Phycisphaerae bacterium]
MIQPILRFHGAAGEVTGSMHLLETNGYTIALDCGLFQGKRAEALAKNRALPDGSRKLDAILLSHAHIDHCGRLPLLAKLGFDGPVYCTAPTRDLASILLVDSAHVQEEDVIYWNKKRVKKGDAPIEPLYTQDDAAKVAPLFKGQRLGETFEVVPGVRATFHEAGHMLGSAGVRLECDTGGKKPVTLVFTGDLGRPNMPILCDPAPLPDCDYVITESTYGGRNTEPPKDLPQQLAQIINETVARGGKLIIPSFAVGRTQTLVYIYNQLLVAGMIEQAVPMVVDSPLALAATEVYRRHTETYDHDATRFKHINGSLFDSKMVHYIQNVEESKALHGVAGSMIIVSASGMCEAGRILHHLKNNMEDPRNTILIVGYQAANTLGRRLVEKVREVKIFGEMYKLKARVKTLNGFSAHANATELRNLLAPLAPGCRQAFVVHGEPDQTQALADGMRADGFRKVAIPESGEAFELK